MKKLLIPVIALITGTLGFGEIKAHANDTLILNKADSIQFVDRIHMSHCSHSSHSSHSSHYSSIATPATPSANPPRFSYRDSLKALRDRMSEKLVKRFAAKGIDIVKPSIGNENQSGGAFEYTKGHHKLEITFYAYDKQYIYALFDDGWYVSTNNSSKFYKLTDLDTLEIINDIASEYSLHFNDLHYRSTHFRR